MSIGKVLDISCVNMGIGHLMAQDCKSMLKLLQQSVGDNQLKKQKQKLSNLTNRLLSELTFGGLVYFLYTLYPTNKLACKYIKSNKMESTKGK